jgi:hypothetical protein
MLVAWLVKWSRRKRPEAIQIGLARDETHQLARPLIVQSGQGLHALAHGRRGACQHLGRLRAGLAQQRFLADATEVILAQLPVGHVDLRATGLLHQPQFLLAPLARGRQQVRGSLVAHWDQGLGCLGATHRERLRLRRRRHGKQRAQEETQPRKHA